MLHHHDGGQGRHQPLKDLCQGLRAAGGSADNDEPETPRGSLGLQGQGRGLDRIPGRGRHLLGQRTYLRDRGGSGLRRRPLPDDRAFGQARLILLLRLAVDGRLGIAEGSHIRRHRLRMSHKEPASRHQTVIELAHQLGTPLPVEIDHHIAAENHMEGTLEGKDLRHQIEGTKEHRPPQLRHHLLHIIGKPVEISLLPGRGQGRHRLFGVTPPGSLLQHFPGNIRGQKGLFPLPLQGEIIRQQHSQGIGFLTGGGSRAPDPEIPVRSSYLLQPGQGTIPEQLKMILFPQKISMMGGNGLPQEAHRLAGAILPHPAQEALRIPERPFPVMLILEARQSRFQQGLLLGRQLDAIDLRNYSRIGVKCFFVHGLAAT